MKLHIKNKNAAGFTLIETLVGVLIFSIIIISGFSALSAVIVGKVKLIEKTAIQKEAFYFSEKLFEMIKTGGLLDYEEYWNRYSYDTTYGSGHFSLPSDFGNEGSRYSCISKNGESMGYDGCLTDFNANIYGTTQNVSYNGSAQLYHQYAKQFIDYNSDSDADGGNEDASSESFFPYIGDDDDLYLGRGPEAFPNGVDVGELYLINSDGDERTYFRINTILDPYAPASTTCTGAQTMVGEGCLGTIEFLKLTGVDAGLDHNDDEGTWDNDGIIDTWLIDSDFSGGNRVVAGSGGVDYWQPVFPDSIHVKDVKFFPYPNKNLEYSWRDADSTINISPYVRISMTLTPSWKNRKKLRGDIPEIEINTTVQLTDIFN